MRVYFTDHVDMPLPPEHRFPGEKYRLLRLALVERGLLPADRIAPAPAADWSDLALVHTPDYLAAVRDGTLDSLAIRRIGFPWSEQLVLRSRHSVGGTVAAARAAMQEGNGANLAGGTHHAFADRGEGYCVFNDVAVAIRVLQRETPGLRCAVVDLDVHQGNGTAAIFDGDLSVLTLSLHGRRNFPFRKERSTIDVALEDGCDDATYLAALDEALFHVLRFRPQVCFFIAGADVLKEDRLGHLALTLDGIRARDARVLDGMNSIDASVVMVMGGGYARPIAHTVEAHVASFGALIQRAIRPG